MGTNNPYGYGFKLALAVIVLYFGVALMMKFADILLPFIMALLLVSILEPVKNLSQACCEGTLLLFMQRLGLCSCCRKLKPVDYGMGTTRMELRQPVKRFFSIISIVWTLVLAGRVFWAVGHIVWLSVQAIITDFQFYEAGAQKRQEQAQAVLVHFGLEKKFNMDMEHMAGVVLNLLRLLLEEMTTHGVYFISQLMLTAIFSLFLLYSPPQRDFSPAMGGVFRSMETYLKLKTLISAIMGVTNGTALAFIGLELPAAWGLLTFLANFIPYIGAPIVSLMPCIIALLDVRKSLTQVVAAFIAQFALHFTIANFIEPIIFGISEEIHSVVVLLGLSFFGYVWGIAGMFLGVPLLYATHAWLTVVARSSDFSTEAREDSRFLMAMLEGRWLADTEVEDESQGVLTGPIELASSEDMAFQRRQSSNRALDEVAESAALKGECSSAWTLRNPDTGDVLLAGLMLRWALMGAMTMLLFLGFGVDGIIAPSSAAGSSSAATTAAVAGAHNFTSTAVPEHSHPAGSNRRTES
mmetsp:Transcript_65872/g.157468  ORF Transcript_65872/g.157468 Transcript_65872/m.157468 type:complete len:524 (-) Transcript_65872:29-1600(-)